MKSCCLCQFLVTVYSLADYGELLSFGHIGLCKDNIVFGLQHPLIINHMDHNINPSHVVEALTVIGQPKASPEQIHLSNKYLTECETHPDFPLILLQIFAQPTQNSQLSLSSLLLFSNVIKRNWTNRGKSTMKTGMDKQKIKDGIMKACLLHGMQYYKHFNALFKTMARHCYPSNYKQMHDFVIESLQNMADMAENTPQTFVTHPYTVPVLSMLKAILKQYSSKRIGHNQQDFKQYIAPVVVKSMQLSLAIQKLLAQLFQSQNKDHLVAVLQHIRKADKITLYGLTSMPTAYQSEKDISEMVRNMVIKLKEYDDVLGISQLNHTIRQEVEKYMIGILELIAKMQNSFPFLFTAFLKDYLTLLLNMLMIQIPNGRYSNDKLISTIIVSNIKPINTYPYYTKPQDFRASIYCRKAPNSNHCQLQEHCYGVFQEVYSHQLVNKLMIALISEVMTVDAVSEGQKADLNELVLEDVEIAIVDQVAEPNAYDNCISLCKVILKNFKETATPVLIAMLNQLNSLRHQGQKGKTIIGNLIDIVLFLPHTISETELPLNQVQQILSMLYQQKEYKYLSRIIRKYYQFFETKHQQMCLDLLVQIVSSPVTDISQAEVVYQSALALKTVISETYEFQGLSDSVLVPCISNILLIMKHPQFVKNPTLLWPIINLIIKILGSLQEAASVQSIAILITNGLSNLLSSANNQELITCALSEMTASLMHMVFGRIKEECPLQGTVHESSGAQKINRDAFLLLEGVCMLVRMNLNNPALQNYDNIYRLWLSLVRHYPTLYQQRIYNFQLSNLNSQLKQLFQGSHLQVLQDNPVLFIELLEEMYLIGLIPLSQQKVSELMVKYLGQEQEENKRIRMVLAITSLYLSYAMTAGHIPQMILYILKQLLAYKNKISTSVNTLRCFLYLAINHFMLTRSSAESYQMFTNAVGGSFVEWFEPFVFSMQYVSSKQVSKLNAALIFKAITEIGVANYAQMLVTPREEQYPIDWVLRTINAKLDAIPEPSKYHEQTMYKAIIPNDMTPDFGIVKMRKIRLQFGSQAMRQIMEQDLRDNFKQLFSAIFGVLNWGVDDLQERVGYGTTVSICNLLGWQIPNLSL